VDSLDGLRDSFSAAEDRRLHSPAAAYAFTTSALDDTLAPPGNHTVYLACPAAPFDVHDGWESTGPRLAEDLLDQVEQRAPGFRDSVNGVHVRSPAEMTAELRWAGAHPMHLDVTPDQLGPLRPTPRWRPTVRPSRICTSPAPERHPWGASRALRAGAPAPGRRSSAQDVAET